MAVSSEDDRVVVWKFKETGLIPLCGEVMVFVAEGGCKRYEVDPNRAYYTETENEYQIVFPR